MRIWISAFLFIALTACGDSESKKQNSQDADIQDAGLGTDATISPDADLRGAHEKLLDELVGFGQNTSGGLGGEIVEVTSLADDGAGSLRQAVASDQAKWIRFQTSGLISLQSPISVGSNTTIDGRGADITITGDGLYVQNGKSNVIINNLKLRDTDDDMLRLYNGGENMWVHHCTLENGGDGAFDATEKVSGVTVSYTHIRNHDKAMLVGAGSPEGDGDTMRWTGHHNWYENVVQRLPFIRFGQAHSFNNLFEWRSGTAMAVRLTPGQLLVENNIFAPQTNVGHKLIAVSDGASARLVGNLEMPLPNDEIEYEEVSPESVFDPSQTYSYELETADSSLIEKIKEEAGWQDIPFPE